MSQLLTAVRQTILQETQPLLGVIRRWIGNVDAARWAFQTMAQG